MRLLMYDSSTHNSSVPTGYPRVFLSAAQDTEIQTSKTWIRRCESCTATLGTPNIKDAFGKEKNISGGYTFNASLGSCRDQAKYVKHEKLFADAAFLTESGVVDIVKSVCGSDYNEDDSDFELDEMDDSVCGVQRAADHKPKLLKNNSSSSGLDDQKTKNKTEETTPIPQIKKEVHEVLITSTPYTTYCALLLYIYSKLVHIHFQKKTIHPENWCHYAHFFYGASEIYLESLPRMDATQG
ncbi:hypothetical protein PPACK8108_LOCUS5792 [Phakopsora pachyrhizi]|uniref:Uncharacterized protein n=1 Tax=Phakopsora pachyrhizi TaxID=170000 RepID=A0AAV0ARK4_PHAPC|nr:hypothetical protein PPACK8108_LOCUS5792 [Phakopsora pachyrhizi]